jgi:hypothetical protein
MKLADSKSSNPVSLSGKLTGSLARKSTRHRNRHNRTHRALDWLIRLTCGPIA